MFRSSNPAFSERVLFGQRHLARGRTMTLNGAINRAGFLTMLVIGGAVISWSNAPLGGIGGLALLGAFGGLILAFATIFKPTWSPFTAPVYAFLEGLFLGGISFYFESIFPGLVFQAVLITFGILASILMLYRMGVLKATPAFTRGVVAATLGIGLVYFASMLLGFFGIPIPYIHEGGMIGIGFSLFVVVIAALNLVLDFHLMETAAEQGAPKFMEWYTAFALIVTLVWLYLEVLKLLAKLASSRD